MAQVPGLGLDQSQLADIINQQYKGYSQKQRNQMMQSAAATPDNWGAITQQANKTATQPTEFLGAGRTSDIPNVSYNGERYTPISPDQYQQFESKMPEFGKGEFSPNYTNAQASYYNSTGLGKLNQLSNVYDYLGKINPQRTKTETWTPSAEQLASRKPWDNSPLRPDPSLGYQEVYGGQDENGNNIPSTWTRQVQDTPLTYTDFMNQYGATPAGGWSDANTKFSSDNASLQRWMSDSSFLPQFSLYGSGTPADIQQGFNILQRMSPQNIGEFWGLSPETKKGMLENPANALQFMRATANPANRDWLSIGAEGGYSGIDSYQFDPQKGMTVDPSRYLQIDDSNNGLLGSLGLDGLRGVVEPIGNIAGAVFSGGIPWGSIVAGADNLSTGNDQAILGNVINGLVSYGGSQISLGGTGGAPVETAVGSSGAAANSMAGSSGGIFGSGVSLGSTAANQAAQSMIMNAGANYARTGDLENALKAAAFSTAAGSAGNWLGNTTRSSLGEIGSKALGGAASGGLNSLFSKNSPVAGSLFGAMSGGLHGFLNSTDRSNNTYNREQDTKNRNIAQTATKLARLFTRK